MPKLSSFLVVVTALICLFEAQGLLVKPAQLSSRSNSVGRLFAGKDKNTEEEVIEKKGPGGKDVIRGILWATTPWIFNSYEVHFSLKMHLKSRLEKVMFIENKHPTLYNRTPKTMSMARKLSRLQ